VPGPRSLDLGRFVRTGLSLRRALWDAIKEGNGRVERGLLPISSTTLRSWKTKAVAELQRYGGASKVFDLGLVVKEGGRVSLLETHTILRPFMCPGSRLADDVASSKLQADVAYLLWHELRANYGNVSLSEVAPAFRALSAELKAELDDAEGTHDIRAFYQARRHRYPLKSGWIGSELDLFLDVAFSLEELAHGRPATDLRIRREWLDPGLLTSRLFGFRTGIPGLDVLFEGGLSLADRAPGRVIVVRGPFGSGKSILSLCIAAEVARKGGLASIIPLDDTMSAIESYLANFNLLEGLRPTRGGAGDTHETPGAGGRLDIKHRRDLRKSCRELFVELRKQATSSDTSAKGGAPLKLLVLDPINSVFGLEGGPAVVRDELGKLIDDVREGGANLLIVAERDHDSQSAPPDGRAWLDELPYMADIVIELFSEKVHEYEQRFIEVKKSRFQRERRGQHPVSLAGGTGVSISPSSPAMSSLLTPAPPPGRDADDLEFGWPEFEKLVGKVKQGHTFAFRGPLGSMKTLVALRFLAHERKDRPWGHLERRSLFLTDRSNRPLRAYSEAYSLTQNAEGTVDHFPFGSGYVQPGRLLLEIKRLFAEARDQGIVYDRVAFANAGRWDVTAPFIHNDPGFGAALIDLFQQENASVVFVCAERDAERDSMLQRVLVDRVTALIDFERVEHNGASRVLCRVIRTPSEPGSHDWHEATVFGGQLRLSPSLLRLRNTGPMSPPEVVEVSTTLRLFTAEDEPQRDPYLARLEQRLQSVLMTKVSIEKLDGTTLTDAVQLGALSAASDLHIMQIDEFQLPVLKSSRLLHPFKQSQWEVAPAATTANRRAGKRRRQHAEANTRLRLSDLDPKEIARITLKDPASSDRADDHVVAVPYYENIALLTLRTGSDLVDASSLKSWSKLRKAAADAEKHLSAKELFFDFSQQMPENFSCLFLEMHAGFSGAQPTALEGEPAFDALKRWIEADGFDDALDCFLGLCRRGYQAARQRRPALRVGMADSALVTRQWYLSLVGADTSESAYEVHPLPGNTSVSGEWYLGVWARSAVPDIGFQIILDELTSRKAEFARLQQHVGLPATTQFYERTGDGAFFPAKTSVSPHLNLRQLIRSARRRSDIPNYYLFSPVLAQHLQDALSLPKASVRETIKRLIDHTRIVLGADATAIKAAAAELARTSPRRTRRG